MGYDDWGDNAHWYYGFDTDASTTYDWSVTVSNSCGTSQTVSGSFSTDCNDTYLVRFSGKNSFGGTVTQTSYVIYKKSF